MQIAIDGPSGAGKSTIAKKAAQIFGFIYVDTGALYRAVGYFALQQGVNPKDERQVTLLLSQIKLMLSCSDEGQRVSVNGVDVTSFIRTEEISMAASDVSSFAGVRDFLLSVQRDIAAVNNVIMDGRDIGTVILPNAQLKIFLTADSEERATRRVAQLAAKGIKAEYETVHADIIARDKQDSERLTAPLKAATDAILLDSTAMDFEETLSVVTDLIKTALNSNV